MSLKTDHFIYRSVVLTAMWIIACFTAMAADSPLRDTVPGTDSLKYPIHDRYGDRFSNPGRNSLDLKTPINIRDSIIYDPTTRQYYIIEKVGTKYYRKPTYLTFEEFTAIQARKAEIEYFKKRSNILSSLNRKNIRPKMNVYNNLFNRIFGAGPDGIPKVEIRPQGDVNIIAGYQGQNIKNPALPEKARKNGGFDFDMNANLSVIGSIGDKLKLPINYNTQANFNFENQLKLDYAGTSDEILKRLEAGNISFASKGTLIPGAQQLFGIKAQLQFGKLTVTGAIANQQSQRQTMGLQGGATNTYFEFKANDYEENRHFLLSQYFRNNFNKAMKDLPVVNSQVQILRIEVWVTNRNGSTTETRDIVGLMDLGEFQPFSPFINSQTGSPYPYNDANDIYRKIINDPSSRNSSQVTNKLASLNLRAVQDFEKTFARKLTMNLDYQYNPLIGFISLNQPLQPDEVLGVAFQYTLNGKVYQVGEFSQDVAPDTTAASNITGQQKVLFLKLLKATSQRTNLPIWDLMMKNVYALKAKDGGVLSTFQSADFKLNVLYEQPSLGQKRYLPEGDKTGTPIITLLNLDRLNSRNDPMPDGVFDYLEGYTVISQQARIIFPLLEPFGKDLEAAAFASSPQNIKDKYIYYPLYDTIKEIAKTFANLDRFIISGSAKGQSTSEISLGAFNVPPGSVSILSGGQVLVENVDYSIDYNLGTVRILNQSIINSGVPVTVQFENNAGFGIQQRNFQGLRLDYAAVNTAKKQFNVGGTIVRLGERPFFTKTNYNDDPIRNTMFGLDFNYRNEVPRLTRWLDKLPFYSTNEMSTITAYGEGAMLKPGHPPQIGKGSEGLIFVDDFEGSRNSIDLRFPLVSWGLATTPQGNGLFPEANLRDSLEYGFNRARLAFYNIEPVLQDKRNANNPVKGYEDFTDPRIRPVNVTEIYPNRTPDFGQATLVTFDIAYYPTDIGPYNFDARPGSVTAAGKLLNPQNRWGGIMRGIDQVDFETGNVEFIEFWVQDPFLKNPASTGGQMYFNLGNISEDVLRDGKRFFENGISGTVTKATEDSSGKWGKVPANPIQVTQAFSNDPADRELQDAGFDGLINDAESRKFKDYLDALLGNYGASSPIYQKAITDPSKDDYKNYRDATYDQSQTGILGRYKNINNPQGNSPVATSNDQFVNAFTLYPDQEEFNKDNTLNELEEYFQYRVEMQPSTDPMMRVGNNFITDKREFTPNGGVPERWYLFRVPIAQYEKKVGSIPDFKSIRFMRIFLNGFEDSVVMRFAKLELVRNTWRRFNYQLDTTGIYDLIPANTATTFNQLAVNIEENSSRKPVPYVTPPGVVRQQQLSNNNVNVLLNEQSLSMQICNLTQGESRGVFKTMNLDLRQYSRMQMYWHAESVNSSTDIQDNELYAVMRLGNDLINNYYEIRIPLKMTPWGTTASNPDAIWPAANEVDFPLEGLTKLKVARNIAGNVLEYFRQTDADGREYAILGNPNLGELRVFFLGVENRNKEDACTEVWVNELRLSGLDEEIGWAALGRVDFKLADLGTLYVSAAAHSTGFGALDQRVNQRSRDYYLAWDIAANLELGKLLPKKLGISIPMYASIQRTTTTPEYDPYDLDIPLKAKLKATPSEQQDSIRNDAVDVKTIKTINFTNVKKINTSGKRQRLWSIENIDLSYSFYKEEQHNPLIENNELIRHRAGIGYNYSAAPKYWEPMKNVFKSKSPWLSLIRDFNLNPVPSLLGFRADLNRQFGGYRPRNVGGPKGGLPETYDKFFTFDRIYNLRWDLTKSINIDYSATNKSWIDEDSGRLDKVERKKMWDNVWKGGRTIFYDQKSNVTYTFPLSKIPALDWTSLRFGYNATYNWLGASLIARNLGNTLANTQQVNLTGELDFTKLYNKSRFFRAVEDDAPPPPPQPEANKTDTTGKKKKKDKTQPLVLSPAVKFAGRIITAFKRVSLNYSENSATTLYGYTDSTKHMGMNFKSNAPGLGFVFGQQPDTNFVNNLAKRGLLTGDSTFNYLNKQDFNQKLGINAQLIPIRDLTIDVNLDKSFGKSYSELYKDTAGYSGKFDRLSPYAMGSFSISYISYKTLFEDIKSNEVSETFKIFETNRIIISERMAKLNRYSQDINGNPIKTSDGYYKGYGKYAQDVLLPAFIAAYTGKDPNSIALVEQGNPNTRNNPFKGYLPRPNWRLTYNGLTRLKGMEKIFTSFTISHAYNSTLSMNSYNSSLLFEDPLRISYPGFVDTLTGNFIPFFLVPNITISERFEPFFDVDMQFTNQLTARFEYKKSRILSLSLIDFQLSENRTTEYVFGAGWRKRGVFAFLKWKGKPLDNDAAFRLDFSIRDDATANSRLDQSTSLPTAGQKVVFINPSIDYVISNRVNIKFYFEQRRVEPKISTAPPITNTRAGMQIRISLAQ